MNAVTVLHDDPIKTDETNSELQSIPANEVTNGIFMDAIFRDLPESILPVQVEFSGNPASVRKGQWKGLGRSVELSVWSAVKNNYFSLAVFSPDEGGFYRRKKKNFKGLHAVMCDDVGTKVDREKLSLPPSWVIETSEGNFQAGYILEEPLTDTLIADQLMKSIIDAGLCDSGANGPTTRLARLPIAINGKHKPEFSCRLTEWHPDLRYSIEGLVDGLNLNMEQAKALTKGAVIKPALNLAPPSVSFVLTPRPMTNPVVDALIKMNLYKNPLPDDKHDITCPWVCEHTDAIDNGTAYFEPNYDWPVGGFKCHHGHCAERSINDFIDFLGVSFNEAKMKHTMRVKPGYLTQIVDASRWVLANTGSYYQRGGSIVSIQQPNESKETRIDETSTEDLALLLAHDVNWRRFDERKKDWADIDPPEKHLKMLHGSGQHRHLPVLSHLTRQPYLTAAGELIAKPGYDKNSQTFGAFAEHDFNVPDKPTREDAEKALAELKSLIEEFVFLDEVDEAAALSAFLTASIRPSLSAAPMFHVKAHMPGSGKSYLCELITAFASPQRGELSSFPSSEEECQKQLVALLRGSSSVIEYDNLTTNLVAWNSLCTVLTTEQYKARILQTSKTISVSTRVLFLSSGNNVDAIKDMTRRTMTICLRASCANPAQRAFKNPHLVNEVRSKRGYYISLALTIIRAWVEEGRPMTECKPLASFTDWSVLCRQPLLWLDCPDPAEAIYRNMSNDPDQAVVSHLLKEWVKVFGHTPVMVREVMVRLENNPINTIELSELLEDLCGDRGSINRKKLGQWLKSHADHVAGGLRLIKASSSGAAAKWAVVTAQ